MAKGPRTKPLSIAKHPRGHLQSFENGDTIPRTGLYSVHHPPHLVPREVTLRKGEVFPPCSACTARVEFRLLSAAPAESDDKSFKVILYALPVQEEDNTGTGAVAV